MRTVCIVWVCLVACVAGADEPVSALSYEAPQACPGRDIFEARVRQRASESLPGARAKPLVVVVRSVEGGYSGTLARAGDQVRKLSAPHCTELVDALALVAALAIVADDEPANVASSGPAPSAALLRSPPGRRLKIAGWAVTGLGLLATTAAVAGGIVFAEGSCEDVLRGVGSCARLAGAYTLSIAGGAAAIELSAGIAMIVIGHRREKRARAAPASKIVRSR